MACKSPILDPRSKRNAAPVQQTLALRLLGAVYGAELVWATCSRGVAGEPTGRTKRDSLTAGLDWRSVIAGDPRARRGELLTTAQAAAALGVRERTLRRYLSSGLLAFRRLPDGHYGFQWRR
jgi:hypothetical protein